ncbi:MAG: helix-turn-helix domain-containing protein [Thermaerobacter sp.]|nr:helix-turn-helix domain-containing protein [Thermaerobacter sp.]
MERKYLNVDEVAETLGVSRGLIYKMVAEGIMPHLKIGSRILVPADWEDRLANNAASF